MVSKGKEKIVPNKRNVVQIDNIMMPKKNVFVKKVSLIIKVNVSHALLVLIQHKMVSLVYVTQIAKYTIKDRIFVNNVVCKIKDG
jgi:hypothetical protein